MVTSNIIFSPISPPCHGVRKFELLSCFSKKNSIRIVQNLMKKRMKKRTGEGDKGKRGRTVSDDVGGNFLSDTSTSVREQCVGESSTGGHGG